MKQLHMSCSIVNKITYWQKVRKDTNKNRWKLTY